MCPQFVRYLQKPKCIVVDKFPNHMSVLHDCRIHKYLVFQLMIRKLMWSYFGAEPLEDRAKNKSVIATINLSRSPTFRLYGNGYRKDVLRRLHYRTFMFDTKRSNV